VRPLRILAFAAASLAAISSAAQSEPLVQTVEEHRNDQGEIEKRASDFVHRSSGFVYPVKLGEMPARRTVTYGTADAAVYYTLYGGANGDPWIDLYVYPVVLEPVAEIAEVEKALVGNFKASAVAAPNGLPAGPSGAFDGWYSGSVEGQNYLTGYRIVRSGDWYIKARISVPAAGGQPAIDRAMRGIGAIPWTSQSMRPAPATTAPITTN
jgi:hypothetical protein